MNLTYKYRIKDRSAKKTLARHAFSVNQVRLHVRPVEIRDTVALDTPNSVAIVSSDNPDDNLSLIAWICSGTSFADPMRSERNLPPSEAWPWFSALLHQARFSTAFLPLSKSIWLTSLQPEIRSKNASATKRCTLRCEARPFFQRETVRYPSASNLGANIIPRLTATPPHRCPTGRSRLLTSPAELTSYRCSKPAIGIHVSMRCILPHIVDPYNCDRDVNAATNILRIALSAQRPAGESRGVRHGR